MTDRPTTAVEFDHARFADAFHAAREAECVRATENVLDRLNEIQHVDAGTLPPGRYTLTRRRRDPMAVAIAENRWAVGMTLDQAKAAKGGIIWLAYEDAAEQRWECHAAAAGDRVDRATFRGGVIVSIAYGLKR